MAYKEINNKLNVVIDEVKTLKGNTTRVGQRMQNACQYHTSEVSICMKYLFFPLYLFTNFKLIKYINAIFVDVEPCS
ncbi:hypothetical protein GIB67_026391 [Kingdonia uniflora]|uniref:Uncharacterized protein n=1 Tax=Kingdonia uniflora TaxID=39325 RepID=A0A7J7P6F9_9MAGN|nr:hypothetical protein GIB67_026391 [Kingdonia uniflora]